MGRWDSGQDKSPNNRSDCTIIGVVAHDDSSETFRIHHRPSSLAHLYIEAQADGSFDALGGSVALQTLLFLAEKLVRDLAE